MTQTDLAAGAGHRIEPQGSARLALGGGDWRDYLALLKPRVMSLAVFTALCGLLAAPVPVHPLLGIVAILMIAVGAGAAGAFNQLIEIETDALMKRTAGRPLPAGRMEPAEALAFALLLSVGSVATLALATNWVAAAILAGGIVFYALVYIGWAAATGDVTAFPIILFLIVFFWTPPHFWALALFVAPDYSRAGIPMLPVTHGFRETRKQILGYTVALVVVSLLPLPLGLAGSLYGAVAAVLGLVFLALAVSVFRSAEANPSAMKEEKRLFKFSILYLFLLFTAVVADAWMPA